MGTRPATPFGGRVNPVKKLSDAFPGEAEIAPQVLEGLPCGVSFVEVIEGF